MNLIEQFFVESQLVVVLFARVIEYVPYVDEQIFEYFVGSFVQCVDVHVKFFKRENLFFNHITFDISASRIKFGLENVRLDAGQKFQLAEIVEETTQRQ